MEFAQCFRLSDAPGTGVRCDEGGMSVGATPLLERATGARDRGAWRPRPLADLDRDVSEAYGFSVTCAAKLAGLASVAHALNDGDVARAQVAALLLRFPNPPVVTKTSRSRGEFTDLVSRLKASGLLGLSHTASNLQRELKLPAARATGSSVIDKLNPYHDENGRFTDAAGAVATSGANAAIGAQGNVVTGAPSPTNAGASRDSSEPAVATTRVVTAQRLSCLDAFRACVQDAIFVGGRSTAGCTAALATCKTTGLPTIFPPGIWGQQ
jgi:hypothetical protein